MGTNQIQVNLKFNADVQQAKQSMLDLQNSLRSLTTTDLSKSMGSMGLTQEIQEATVKVTQLRTQLEAATNVNTGKLNLKTFNTQLKTSGNTLEQYKASLMALGPAGQQAFAQLARSVATAETPFISLGARMEKTFTTLANTARWQLASSVINGLSGAMQRAYGYAQDLNKSLTDIRIVSGYSSEEMAKFAESANKAAKALGATTTAYTNAALIYYQQGLSNTEVEERTNATIKMANVTGENAETVSSYMTAIWNNFDDGSKSLEYYADVITALGAATAASSEEIAGGLEKFAAIGETIGLSYEYATAALTTIVAETRQSEDVVGTALKTIFARIQGLKLGESLEDGTDLNKYSTALATVGVNIKDASGNLKDMDVILDEVGGKWDSLTKAEQMALAQTVAGVRQYTQFIALMDNYQDVFQENLSTAYGAEGSLDEQQEIYAESWEAASKRAQAAMENIYQSLLNDEFFIKLTNMFAEMGEGLGEFLDNIGGVKTVLLLLGSIITQVFNQQIVTGITNAGNSIFYMTKKGKASLDELRHSANQALQQMANDGSTGGKIMTEAYKELGSIYDTFNEKLKGMTEEQKKQANMLLQQKETRIAETEELVKQLQLEEKKLKTSSGRDRRAINRYLSSEEAQTTGQITESQATVVAQNLQGLNNEKLAVNAQNEVAKAGTAMKIDSTFIQSIKQMNNELEVTQGKYNALNEVSTNVLEKISGTHIKTNSKVSTTKETLNSVVAEMQKYKGQSDIFGKDGAAAFDTVEEAVKQLMQTIETADPAAQLQDVADTDLNNLRNGLEEVKKIIKNLGGDVSTLEGRLEKLNGVKTGTAEGRIQENLRDNKGNALPIAKDDQGNVTATADDVFNSGVEVDRETVRQTMNDMRKNATETATQMGRLKTLRDEALGGDVWVDSADTVKQLKGQMTNLSSEAQRTGQSFEQKFGKKGAQALKELNDALEANKIDAVNDALIKLDDTIDDMGISTEDTSKKLKNLTNGRLNIDDTLEQAEKSGATEVKADLKLNTSIQDNDVFAQQLDDLKTKTNSFAQGLTDLSSSLMTVSMGIQAIQSLGNIWSDEDLTLGEKLTQTMMSLSMLIPVVTMVLKNKTLATMASNLATKLGIGVKVADTAATEAQTVANWALNASMGIILIVIVALIAAVWGIVKAFEAWKASTPEGQLKRDKESLQEFTTAAQEAENALNDLKSSFEEFNNLQNAFDGLTKGTEEWTEAMYKANQVALEILEKYPELYSMTNKQGEKAVTIEDGVIKIADWAQQNLVDQKTMDNVQLAREKAKKTYNVNKQENEETTTQIKENIVNNVSGEVIGYDYAGYEINYNELLKDYLGNLDNLEQDENGQYITNFHDNRLSDDSEKAINEALTKALNDNAIEINKLNSSIHDNTQALNTNASTVASQIVNSQVEGYSGLNSETQKAINKMAEQNLMSEEQTQENIYLNQDNNKYTEWTSSNKGTDIKDDKGNKITDTNTLVENYAKDVLGINDDIKIKNYHDVTGDQSVTIEYETTNTDGETKTNKKTIQAEDILTHQASQQAMENLNTTVNDTAQKIIKLGASTDSAGSAMIKMSGENSDILDLNDKEITALGATINDKGKASVDRDTLKSNLISEAKKAGFEDLTEYAKTQGYETGAAYIDAMQEQINNKWDSDNAAAKRIQDITNETNAIIAQGAEELGINEKGLKDYAENRAKDLGKHSKELQGLKKGTKEYAEESAKLNKTAAKIAVQEAKTAKAFEKTQEVYEDNKDIIKEGNKESLEYANAMGELATSLSDVFGTDLGVDFVQENLEDIQKALDGDTEAFERLQKAAAKEILLNLDINEERSQALLDKVAGLHDQAMQNMPDIEVGAQIDDANFINQLENIVTQAGMTADEANAYFRSMGFEPEFETTTQTYQEPVYGTTTYTEVTDWQSAEGLLGGFSQYPKVMKTWSEQSIVDYADKTVTVPAFSADGKPEVKLTKTGGAAAAASSAKSAGGTTGKSGSKKKTQDKKKSKDEAERYHVINKQLDSMGKKLDDISKKKDRAFGPEKLKYMDQEIAAMQEQIRLQEQYKKEVEANLVKDKAAIEKYGAVFDADGNITNYEQIVENQLKKYNKAVDRFNASAQEEADDEALEKAEEKYDEFKEILEQYEETNELNVDVQADLTDFYNKMDDLEMEKFSYEIEYKIEIDDSKLEYLDFLLNRIDDDAFAAADAIAVLGQQTDIAFGKLNTYLTALDELMAKHNVSEADYSAFMQGDDTVLEKYATIDDNDREKMKEIRSDMIAINEQLFDIQETVQNKVLESFQAWTDEIQKQIDLFDTYNSVLEHYKNIIDIVGKDTLGISDKMLKNLRQTQLDVAKDQINASKTQLEAMEVSRAKAQAAYKEALILGDTESAEAWKRDLAEIDSMIADAEDSYLSSWENALQMARDMFTEAVEQSIEDFKDAIAGSFGSFDLMNSAYSKHQEERDRYLADYKKVYELNKLNRDIQKSIDETDNLKAKQELSELQDEINKKLADGSKMTQYDLEVLQKQFEVEQARIALEEAQNAKNQVRLVRNSSGEYGYMYTANQEEIDKATAEYENKIFELADLTQERIKEMESEILSTYEQFTSDIAAINEQYASGLLTEDEYNAAIERTMEFYDDKLKYLGDQLGIAIGNAKTLYEGEIVSYEKLTGLKILNDETYIDHFKETFLAQLGDGYASIEELQRDWTNEAKEMLNEQAAAGREFEREVEEIMNEAGTSTRGFASEVNKAMTEVREDSKETVKEVKNLKTEMIDSFGDTVDAVRDWQREYSEAINTVIEDIRSLIQAQNELNNLKTQETPKDETKTEAPKKENSTPSTQGDGKVKAGDKITLNTNGYSKRSGGSYISDPKYGKGSKLYIQAIDGQTIYTVNGEQWVHLGTGATYNKGRNDVGWVRVKDITGYDTGGYTGSWGSEGRLAMLHQKELVLNPTDTENMLSAVSIVRDLLKEIDLRAVSAIVGATSLTPGITPAMAQTLEQDVTIHAEFPNVQDRNEIEEAFKTLVNEASQYANRKR